MDFVRADNCLIRALIKSEKVYISFIKRQYEDNNSHIALHQKSWQRQTTEMTQLKAKKPLSQLTGNCVHNSQDSRTSFTFSKRFSPKSCFKKWVVYLFIHLEEQTQYFLKCIGDSSSAFNILSHLLASTVDVLCICYFTHWWRSKFIICVCCWWPHCGIMACHCVSQKVAGLILPYLVLPVTL